MTTTSTPKQHKLKPMPLAAIAIAAATLSACATEGIDTSSRVERTLSAAGFQMTPANTPERLSSLRQLPPNRLIAQPNGDAYGYVYADPDGCGCLYVGDAKAYQRYQAIAVKQRIAQQNAEAAADYNMAMNWDLWGPYPPYWYGWRGPIVVHERVQHHNH